MDVQVLRFHHVCAQNRSAQTPEVPSLPERVTCETELIALIRSKAAIEAGGVLYGKTAKDKMGPAHKILTYSFWFYNKGGALLKKHKRTLKGKIENPATPIDPIEIPYLHNIKKQK